MSQLLSTIPLSSLTGVGAKVAEKLTKIGLNSVQDLLFHLPSRYEDRTRIYPIAQLHTGLWAAIQGQVMTTDVSFGRRKMLTVKVSDGNGTLTLRFFNFTAAMKNNFTAGKTVHAYGEIKRGNYGFEIVHPDYKFHVSENKPASEATLTPVYPTTEGLRQITLRNLTEQALELLAKSAVKELLPAGLYDHQTTLGEALHTIHRPPPSIDLEQFDQGQHPAQLRLIIEELLAQNLSMLAVRSQGQQDLAQALPVSQNLKPKLLAQLPFSPTKAQDRVVREVEQDLQKNHPMMRLVQGDVGSGKTLVAALAGLGALEKGHQVALMAPTELLAEQHALNFTQWLEPLGIQVGWLAGKLKGKAKQTALEKIANGKMQMVVGTHALFQDQVHFSHLALVIIDEQHRFGVRQRMELAEKGDKSDVLVMTATPIPRSLALAQYGDMDVSILDEKPPGRKPIRTAIVSTERMAEVVGHLQKAIAEGRQCYWVCPLVGESEVSDLTAAEERFKHLRAALGEGVVGLVHGQMPPAEKDAAMKAFQNGETQILVATTVIEVGVDVPKATIMVIERAEIFGLAQLHQLRGRVGRGSEASTCLLLYQSPLSESGTKRLTVMRETNDGFRIAETDLEMRGAGDLIGTAQSGVPRFRIAYMESQAHLMQIAQTDARKLLNDDPDLTSTRGQAARVLLWLMEQDQAIRLISVG